jgi:hypothetical protein
MVHRTPLFTALLLAASGAAAQTGAVAGPSAGLVFDAAAQTVRPIRGVPGAATFGAALDARFPLAAVWISPGQDAIFARDAAGSLHFFQLSPNGLAEAAISDIASVPERVIFSPSGTAAALFAGGQVQIVTGLPGSPAAAAAFTLSHGVRGMRPALGSAALSDDGAYLLFSAGGSIQLANATEGSRVLMTAGFGAAVAFAPGGHDAAVAARGTGAVMIHDVPNTASQQLLAPDDSAFAQLAGLAFSLDGRHLYIASASANSVVTLDTASGARSDLSCSCSPSGLTRMGSAFRITEFSTGPLWLLDAGAPTLRIVFVPAWKEGL